jgi:hypothetical protein
MTTVLANPLVIVTLTVNRYVSLTQGTMVTTGAVPDVVANLTQDGGGRAKMLANSAFEVDQSNKDGDKPVDILFRILPGPNGAEYTAIDLIIKNLQNIDEGGESWIDVKVGSGSNANEVTVTDKARKKDVTTSITYGVYVIIRPKSAGVDYPVGDFGMIDPLFTNR